MRFPALTFLSVLLASPLWADAPSVPPAKAAKIEESTPETDKESPKKASVDADQWARAQKPASPAAPEQNAAAPSPTPAPDNAPAETAPPPANPPAASAPVPPPASATNLPGMQPPAPVKKYTPKPGLNEMKGKLVSKSSDPATLRMLVDGGFNVEFTYDAKTIWVNGGNPITEDDLNFGDELIIRYAGKDLNVVEADRVSKAPQPQ